MGWGLIIKDVGIPKVRKAEIESKLEEEIEFAQNMKEQLLMFAAATPRSELDSENSISGLRGEITEIIENLLDTEWRISLLTIAKDCPEDVTEY